MSSGVEFDEDKLKYAPKAAGGYTASGYVPGNTDNEPRMVQWLIKKGIVKTPGMAQGILVGLAAVNIIITFIVITYFI